MLTDPRLVREFARGQFSVDETVSGDPGLGFYRGHARDGRVIVVSEVCSCSLTPAELLRRFTLPFGQVAPLLYAGPSDAPRDAPLRDPWALPPEAFLVELEPPGKPLDSLRLPVAATSAAHLGLQIAATLRETAAADATLVGLIPQLVYVDGSGSSIELTGIVPRYPALRITQVRARQSFSERRPAFDGGYYMAPEYYFGEPLTPASDVYSLALLLALLTSGKHPFPEPPFEEARSRYNAMHDGDPPTFDGPPEIDALIRGILVPDPSQRMPLAELIVALERLA
jgi:hypothetical protein